MHTVHLIIYPTEEDLDVVEEEINKITREKIGVEVTLERSHLQIIRAK